MDSYDVYFSCFRFFANDVLNLREYKCKQSKHERVGIYIYIILSTSLQDLNLRKYQFSIFQDVPLVGVIVEISAII